jgi:hypothetical protein
MKRIINIPAATIFFVGTLGLIGAYAAPTQTASRKSPVEITGCLQQGPAAKEYLIRTSDGTSWGINEGDLLLNNYLGKSVTVSGDSTHPTASERSAGGAQHFVKAMDVVVESESCQQ